VVEAKYLVDIEDISGLLDASDIRIVDCRFDLADPEAGKVAFLSGHIPGAVYADLDRDLAGPVGPGTGRHPLPDPDTAAASFERLGISEETHVVVYDESTGAVAARAWWLLRWLGHEQASVLNGGFSAWQAQSMPIENGETPVARGTLAPRPRDELVLGTAEIVAAGESVGALRLVDVRSKERYTAQEEPIDRVAGHIPGAINLPYTDNVRADGRWKPVEEIRHRLSLELGPPAGQPWSVMCGSGVTACHLVIAGLLAGYPEPRVYVGSWSEWIADDARRVAKGSGKGRSGGPGIAEYS
jgi:thiosulfate/3-mercaptopyruvate sulfurtransferase